MRRLSLFCLAALLSFWAAHLRAAELPRLVIDSGGHMGMIRDVAFTRDGRFLVSAGDDKVIRIWDTVMGKTIRTIRGQIGEGDGGKINALALSPDNRYLAVGGYFPGSLEDRGAIRVYDFDSGELFGLLKGHKGAVLSLAFSPDGRRLISGSDFDDKTVRIWNVEDPQHMMQLHLLTEHRDGIFSVALSVDGRHAVSTSRDTTIRLWDIDREKSKVINGTGRNRSEQVDAVSFSPDGRYLASGSRAGRVVLWDANTGDLIRELGWGAGVVTKLCFSPDGERLFSASENGSCSIFHLSSRATIPFKHETSVGATAFSPDGKIVVTAGGGTTGIFLRNSETGITIKKLTGEGQAIWAVGFARDGQSIAFGGKRDSDIRQPLKQSILLKEGSLYRVVFGGAVKDQTKYLRALQSANGYTLRSSSTTTTANQRVLYRWQLYVLRSGQTKLIGSDNSDYRHVIQTLTHDGRYAVSGAERGYLTRYKTEGKAGDKSLELVGHTNRILSLAVSPDSKTLLSSSNDQTMKLWDIETGRNLVTIFVGDDEEWVAWTPEGYYTSSLHGDKYIGWHINQGADKAAKFYSAAKFQKDFYRPDVVAEYLSTRDIQVAVQRANDRRKEAGFSGTALSATDVTALLPPSVAIISPKERESTVEEQNLNVRAVIISATLPITAIKVFLNGSPRGNFEGDSNSSTLDLQIKLEPGENTLAIIAFNKQAYSEPELRKINYLPKHAERRLNQADKLADLAPYLKTVFHSQAAVSQLGPEATEAEDRSIENESPLTRAQLDRATEIGPQSARPQVVMIMPSEAEINVEDEVLTIKAAGVSFASPITEVRFSLNGKAKGSVKPSTESKKYKAELQVQLEPGLNVLSVTASDKESTSEPETIKVTCTSCARTNKPDLIFLGIGISKYEHSVAGTDFEDLSFADRDVVEVAKTFESQNSLQPPESRVFNKVTSKVILNGEANRESILKGLEWLSAEAKRNSNNVHVLYLSGHGGMDNHEKYYFYSSQHVPQFPWSVKDIAWSDVMAFLTDAQGKAVIFIDTCHAGGTRKDTDLITVQRKYSEDFVSVFTFLASTENGVSVEKPEWQHGAFTKAVLDGLGGAADIPPKDGKIDVDKLQRYIRIQVPILAPGQRPGYSSSAGFDALTLFSNPPPR